MATIGTGVVPVEGPSGTAELDRSVMPSPARSSQPSTVSLAIPGKAAAVACSTARMSEVRTGREARVLSTTTWSAGISWESPCLSTRTSGSTEVITPMTSLTSGRPVVGLITV